MYLCIENILKIGNRGKSLLLDLLFSFLYNKEEVTR